MTQRETTRGVAGPGRWALGFLTVLAAHGAGIGVLLADWSRQPEAPQGVAMVIDLSLVTASTPVTDAEEAPPLDEPVEEPVEEVVEEEPPPEPIEEVVEPEPDLHPEVTPEVALPKVAPPPPPKPKPKVVRQEPPPKPKPEKEARPPSTSAPSMPAPEAQAQTAVARGIQPQPSRSQVVTWETAVLAALAREKRYPDAARRRGKEGTARVRFAVDGKGTVLWARLEGSAGNESLDREAEDLLRRVSPLPPPPSGTEVERVVPIRFSIR
jgi:protein TonB